MSNYKYSEQEIERNRVLKYNQDVSKKALELAVQTAIGSAKMTINRKTSMTDLISSVATKGGCTEVGVNTMKELNSSKLFEDIIKNTAKKASELG